MGLFSFFLLPKEDAQLQGTNTDTLDLLIPLSPSLFFPFKTLQDGFTFCFGKLSGIHVGGGGATAFISSRKWSVFSV